jgi:ribosomal protein S6
MYMLAIFGGCLCSFLFRPVIELYNALAGRISLCYSHAYNMTNEAEVITPDTNTSLDLAESGARVYELGYHIIPTVKEESIEEVVASIRTVIEKAGGSFIAEGAPVSMKLSYAMVAREGDKNVEYDRSFFGWIKFEAPVAVTEILNEALKADRNILRFIVFRTVREETRARMKIPTLRDVRRTDPIKAPARHIEDPTIAVSEVDLDKAIETLTTD